MRRWSLRCQEIASEGVQFSKNSEVAPRLFIQADAFGVRTVGLRPTDIKPLFLEILDPLDANTFDDEPDLNIRPSDFICPDTREVTIVTDISFHDAQHGCACNDNPICMYNELLKERENKKHWFRKRGGPRGSSSLSRNYPACLSRYYETHRSVHLPIFKCLTLRSKLPFD